MAYWISLNFNVPNHFNSPFLAESEFQNSNVGGTQIKFFCQCQFWNKFDFKPHIQIPNDFDVMLDAYLRGNAMLPTNQRMLYTGNILTKRSK